MTSPTATTSTIASAASLAATSQTLAGIEAQHGPGDEDAEACSDDQLPRGDRRIRQRRQETARPDAQRNKGRGHGDLLMEEGIGDGRMLLAAPCMKDRLRG